MGERLVCNQEVMGSNPFGSTSLRPSGFGWQAIRRRPVGAKVGSPGAGFGLPISD